MHAADAGAVPVAGRAASAPASAAARRVPDGAPRQRCVLVFSGADPSGGAGIAADILAIHAQGAHALPVITALTVQDNERVHEVLPVEADLVLRQARALAACMRIDAVKIGIPGSAANASAIAQMILELRGTQGAELPVVLDPVLASGHGDLLSRGDAVQALAVLLPLATLITPNGPEAAALASARAAPGSAATANAAADAAAGPPSGASAAAAFDAVPVRDAANSLLAQGCRHVLVTGGHGSGDTVVNHWFSAMQGRSWSWERLPGEYHGSGCTLAAAVAALLARSYPMELALSRAQGYCHRALAAAFAIAPGQRIPQR